MNVTRERVKALDRLRGLSIVYMLFTHLFNWFLVQESWWYYAAFPLTNFIGGCTFTFVAGAGLALSVRKRPETPAKVHHLRTFIIFTIGLFYNLVWPGWPNLWAWTILMALGVFRFVGYYALKLPAWVRGVLIAIILVIARPLVLLLVGNVFTNGTYVDMVPQTADLGKILAYILYSVPNQNTFFPYFGFFLGGTLFVDLLLLKEPDKQNLNRRLFFFAGAILVTMGINLGLLLKTNIDLGDMVILYLNVSGRDPHVLPLLASRNSFPWSLTALGAQFLLGLLFLQIEQKVYRNKFLTVFGEFSLTIYLFHNPLYLIGAASWTLAFGLPILILAIFLIWLACWVWWKKANGKYSLEYWINLAVISYGRWLESRKGIPDRHHELAPDSPLEGLPDASGVPCGKS